MGTRSLTIVKEEGHDLCVMYRQYGGYLSKHGRDLAEFLKDGVVVNGISMAETRKIFNGLGCLSASLFAHFKEDVGNVYLYPVGSRDCGEEYIYTIWTTDKGEIKLNVHDVYENKSIFDGTPNDFILKQLSNKIEREEVNV